MDELITKWDAIEAVNDVLAECIPTLRPWQSKIPLACALKIKALPAVQPKRGKWIDAVIPNDNGGLLVQVCDQCNTFFPLAYTGGGHRFCPNCGADMRGGEE